MPITNYSVEASVIEYGKYIKGTLTLFQDEYVFGENRISVNWEEVECEQGTEKVKHFLRTVNKSTVVFKEGNKRSLKFILEPTQINALLDNVKEFKESLRLERLANEKKAREAFEEQKRQLAKENKIREAARLKAEEEYQKQMEEEQHKKEECIQQEREAFKRRTNEKQTRIKKEVEVSLFHQENPVVIKVLSKKAATCLLDNPYRILGVSCLASNEEANSALDKLKKLARLKALGSYQSRYDIKGIDKPIRELSVAQNALVLLKDNTNKFFWFADPDPCMAWYSGKYRIELTKDGKEYGTYDLFLANYMYALLCDPDFNDAETWKRVLQFYCYICRQNGYELLRSRFTKKELLYVDNKELVNSFCSVIFKPILLLCERDDLDAVIRLHKYIKDSDDSLLEGLSRNVLRKLVSWFTNKEADVMNYLQEMDIQYVISNEQAIEIYERGESYCQTVEPMIEIVLRDFRTDAVRYDMVKESYRHTTYQLMYELNKFSNKSYALLFANKCYSYCNADDKKRIKNTFGEMNIKAIDWNVPHTAWDIKGDDFYYGRGRAVDYTQAMYWYRKAAEAGNLYSPNSIGICYKNGHGVPQSDELAASWYKKAYNAGNPQGAYNLAECYYSGTGVQKDIDQALKYWAEASKLGHPSAAQRRKAIFSKVQIERKNHRTRNHICHDLGFQMTTGMNLVVEVTLSHAANAYLVNKQGYHNYLNGDDFQFYGGYVASSPYQIGIPTSNHWYVIVDNGNKPIAGITSSVKVKKA